MICAVCGAAAPATPVAAITDEWGLCGACLSRAPKRAMGCTQVCEVCDLGHLGAPRRLAEWAICTPRGPRGAHLVCGPCLEPARAALASAPGPRPPAPGRPAASKEEGPDGHPVGP